ncbi:MAG TPA: DUF1206 domain-containing protein, partial [Candidatus Acidoferrum sp.]|nr:DUF1206 domain-containing protein [Candidatus Acidoferrum sp.]
MVPLFRVASPINRFLGSDGETGNFAYLLASNDGRYRASTCHGWVLSSPHGLSGMKPQSGFLKFIIRFGFLAKGAVYLAVGLLALQVAVGFGGETGDTKGALEEIGRRPFGGTLLVILAVGLLHYSDWKFVEAFKDPENVGKGHRVLYGASGFLHIYLAYMAAGTVLSGLGVTGGGKSGDQAAQLGTSWLMSQGFGRWLVGAVGVVAFGISISQLVEGYRAKFREKLALRAMHAWEKIAVITLGRMGFCARAVLVALVGLFLVQAAVHSEP